MQGLGAVHLIVLAPHAANLKVKAIKVVFHTFPKVALQPIKYATYEEESFNSYVNV